MRVKASIYNSISNVLILIFTTIMTFLTRTIFIQILGKECIGIDGLFTNILTMLSVAELGLSTAINFSLYEPLEKKDISKINKIMSFYKKMYRYIGIIVFSVGIFLMFFLNIIVKDTTVNNLHLIYFLYLLNTVIIYFVSYKDVLLAADQKYYKLNKLRNIFIFITYSLQCLFLMLTKNYVVYLIILLSCKFIERVLINRYITKHYDKVDFNSTEKLEKKEVNKIFKNIKGMVFHKIGNYFLNSTDNILISTLINISTVGIYSNYLAIISVFRNFISTFLSGITPSFGNLVVSTDNDVQERVFRVINFLSYLIFGFVTVCFFNMLTPFINVWLGNEYVVDNITNIVICINFYFYCLLIPIDIVKNASGIYYVDRFIPIIQVIINLIASIILAPYFGLLGILLGTFLSYITVIIWSKPLIIYKYLFKKSAKKYYLGQIKNLFILIVVCLLTSSIINLLNLKLCILSLIIEGIICFIVYFAIIFISYYKSDEYMSLMSMIKNLFNKEVKK